MLLAECHGVAISATGCTLRLVDSADGGQSWRTSGTAPPGAVTSGSSAGPAGTEEALGQSWLVRTGPSAGYVFASPAVNSRGRPDFAVLWYTSDAGAAWSLRHVPCGFDALSDAVAAAPDGVLAVVCASEPSAGYQVKTTVISTNGGLTWTLHAGCLFRQGCRDLLDGGYLGQIAAVSGQTIYLVGSRSSLLVTRDGGLHWRVVRPFIGDSGDGTSRVIFFGQSDGVVLGAGGAANGRSEIFRTLDGGRTWSTVLPQLS